MNRFFAFVFTAIFCFVAFTPQSSDAFPFFHKELKRYPDGLPCEHIPANMTLADVGIKLGEGMSEEYLHSIACMPPSEKQWKQQAQYEAKFYADARNYTVVFEPLNCQNADVGTTALAMSTGRGREVGPLFRAVGGGPAGWAISIGAGYGVAKYADNEVKKGNYGFAKGFCIAKIGAAIWNVAWLFGL